MLLLKPLVIKQQIDKEHAYEERMAALKPKEKEGIELLTKEQQKSKDRLDLDSVFEGFLHKKLTEKALEFENQIYSDLLKSVSSKIKEIKSENDQKLYSTKIGNIAECEPLLFTKPSQLTFKDDLLFDLYQYINKKITPVSFLQQSFLKYTSMRRRWWPKA